MKANSADNYEGVIIKITKEKFPIIFKTKVEELMGQEGMTKEQAEKEVEGMEIELELYYEKNSGLWGVESAAVESVDCGGVVSPYSQEPLEECDED